MKFNLNLEHVVSSYNIAKINTMLFFKLMKKNYTTFNQGSI